MKKYLAVIISPVLVMVIIALILSMTNYFFALKRAGQVQEAFLAKAKEAEFQEQARVSAIGKEQETLKKVHYAAPAPPVKENNKVFCGSEITGSEIKGEIISTDHSRAPSDGPIVCKIRSTNNKVLTFVTGGMVARFGEGEPCVCEKECGVKLTPNRYISIYGAIIEPDTSHISGGPPDCLSTAVKEQEFKKIYSLSTKEEVLQTIGRPDYEAAVFNTDKDGPEKLAWGYCVKSNVDSKAVKYLITFIEDKVTDIGPDTIRK